MTAHPKFAFQDTNFEHFLDTVLVEVSESELTPAKRKKRRAQSDADPLAFCKIYFPNIFHFPWNAFHRWAASRGVGNYTGSGFRKSGKSAVVYVVGAIKPMAEGIGGIINVNARTLDISIERTAALVRLMMRNKMLVYDYEIELQQDLKGCYIVNNTYLIAGSYSTGLRNLVSEDFKRVRRQINDDLFNKNSVTSELDNTRVTEFVVSEAWGQMEEDGISWTLGNSISADCPIVRLKDMHPDKHFSLPSIDAEGRSTWPIYKTVAEWDEFKKTIPWDVWLGEYMDQPAVKGDVFDPAWIRTININTVRILVSMSACDPSYGQSPAACPKAVATVSMTDKKEIICTDLWIRKESYESMFDYVMALAGRIPMWKVLSFENDFSQWIIAKPYYDNWMISRKSVLPISPHKASELGTQFRAADKDSRILTLVHPHMTGMLTYSDRLKGSKDFEVYKQQLFSFGRAKEKLDGIDAMASAYILIWRYLETGSFKPLKERAFKRLGTFFGR